MGWRELAAAAGGLLGVQPTAHHLNVRFRWQDEHPKNDELS